MNFLYPAAFTGLLLIPVIVLLYMLKKQYSEKEVSSLILWEKMLLSSHAKKPWQKFKNNILMFLEILCLIFLVTALASPVISQKSEGGSYIIVADNSYTMSGKGDKGSKFEDSIESICNFIDSRDKNAVFTVITGEKNPEILISFSENKSDIKERLGNLEISYSGVDKEKTINLLNTFSEDTYDEIIVFSDKKLLGDNEKIQYLYINGTENNLALVYMNHSINAQGIQPFVRVRNDSVESEIAEIALYGDNVLLDIITAEIESETEKDVFFSTIEENIVNITAKLLNDDGIAIDNFYYDTVSLEEKKNAVLFTEGNLFLENALSLGEGFNLYRGNIEDINSISGYFLYIYDGIMPAELPKDGHLLVINPPYGNSFISVFEEAEYSGEIHSMNSGYLNIAENLEFGLNKYKIIETVPSHGAVLLADGDNPLVLAGENENRKYGVLTFDLFDSDLPLKKEFPVFIYELMDWYYSGHSGKRNLNIKTGELPLFTLEPDTRKIIIEAPDGSITEKTVPFFQGEIKSFNIPGHYKLTEISDMAERTRWFSVNIDFENEYYGITDLWHGESDIEIYKTMSLKKIFIFLVLLAITADWYIYKGFKFNRPDLLRTVLIIVILISFVSPHINFRSKELNIVFAVDISDSIGADTDKIKGDLENLSLKEEKNILTGLVAFGKNASVESYISPDNPFKFNAYINQSSTNISNALMLSASLFGEGGTKKIVLISDGNDLSSDVLSYGMQLKEQGVYLDILPVGKQPENEVQLTGVKVPGYVNLNMVFNVEIIIDALADTKGQLLLYRDNILVQNQSVDLKKGSNNFIFSDISEIGGNITYKAEIVCSEDYYYQNNKAYAYTYIEDAPTVLAIGNKGSADAIKGVLENTYLNLDYAEPYGLSADIQWLNKYDLIIMSDISYDTLPEGFGENLKTYVSSGGGLMVLGGENSYALGWYDNTPLEEILPVDMELKDESAKPDLALIMVIDRSGSMDSGRYGMTKMELAKEAVKEGVKGLFPGDSVGVLAFDTEPVWYVETAEISTIDNIEGKISNVSPGGGTSILPALTEAAAAVSRTDAAYKHIILLTDGMAETNGYDDVIRKMNSEGITLSTVAVGSDSDINLLKDLAKKANGRYYYTDEFTDLPQIFLKETMLSGSSHLNNETFYPQAGSSSSILDGIDYVPPLHGYVQTTLKARGDAVLNVKEDIPLLAVWQYGLGRSAAFTSDLKGMWSSDFLASEEGIRIFRNTVSWSLRKQNESGYTIQEDGGTLFFRIDDYEGISQIKAQALWEGSVQEISMKVQSPGVYMGDVSALDEGIYFINIRGEKNGEDIYYSSILQISYSSEYDITLWNQGQRVLSALEAVTEGKIIESLEEALYFPEDAGTAKFDTGPFILIFAGVLLMADIAYRRIGKKSLFTRKKPDKTQEQQAERAEKHQVENRDKLLEEEIQTASKAINGEIDKKKPKGEIKPSTADRLLMNKRNRNK